MSYSLENALIQWEEGWRAYQALEGPSEQRQAERVIGSIHNELRRRIGPTFGADELAALYGEGTDWCQRTAFDSVPNLQLEPQMLADAAFWLYLRNAGDFAGGRRLAV